MKKLFAVFLASMFLCSYACCQPNDGNQPGDSKLIVLTSADNPPYEYLSSDVIVGFDIDLIKLIMARLNRSYELRDVIHFSSIIDSLQAKQGDLAIAAITPTDSRKQILDFSIPYQNNTSALAIVKTRDFANIREGAYFPIELLKDRTLGVQFGTHHEADMRGASVEGVVIRRYDTMNSLVSEMEKSVRGTGILYGVVVGQSTAQLIVRKNPKLTFYKLKFEDPFAVAFPKGSPLREDVNRIINDLVMEGKIVELENKWDISR
jgi:polar amino acid transport system substrate-binding protein